MKHHSWQESNQTIEKLHSPHQTVAWLFEPFEQKNTPLSWACFNHQMEKSKETKEREGGRGTSGIISKCMQNPKESSIISSTSSLSPLSTARLSLSATTLAPQSQCRVLLSLKNLIWNKWTKICLTRAQPHPLPTSSPLQLLLSLCHTPSPYSWPARPAYEISFG